MKKKKLEYEQANLSLDGEYMTTDIEDSWVVNAKLRESDDLEYQKWFNKVLSLRETVQNGFIDFSHKIFTEDLYKYIGDPRQKNSLEIGFGGGRLINAASKYFNMCYGLDILDSSSIEKTKNFLKSQNCNNHQLLHRDNSHVIEDESIDFVYSFIVFQHFKDWNEILNYFSLFKRVMAPGAIAKIYFRGLPSQNSHTISDQTGFNFITEEGWSARVEVPHGYLTLRRNIGEGRPPVIELKRLFDGVTVPKGRKRGIGSYSSLFVDDKLVLHELENNFKILEQPTYQTKAPWISTPSSQFHITFMKE